MDAFTMWNLVAEDANIVVVGHFNPKIFHPEWFVRKEIVPEWDYKDDQSLVNLPELAKLELPGEISLQVTLDQFTIRSGRASSFATVRDLAVSVFSLLRETPVSQFGMNLNRIARLSSKDRWVAFGEMLSPKELWSRVSGDFDSISPEKIEQMMGLIDITYQLARSDELDGWVRARVFAANPSEYMMGFQSNSHINLNNSGAALLVQILAEKWDDALKQANIIYKNLEAANEEGFKHE